MGHLKADLVSNAAGTGATVFTKQWAAKARLVLNMSTATIGDSKNTTSATDGGTGIFTQNLTSAMLSGNYVVTCGGYPNGYTDNDFAWPSNASSVNLRHTDGVSAYTDAPTFSAVVNGDLA